MKYGLFILRNMMVAGLCVFLMAGSAPAQSGQQRTYDYADREDYAYEPPGRYDRHHRYGYDGSEGMPAVPYRPSAPYLRAPAPPSPRHVWIPAGWQWRQGRYVHTPGYWTLPPHKHLRYIPGHWNRTRHGWVWRPGYWVKKNGRAWWQ
ncbi:MAG: hypothetical protein MUF29_00845 [Chitinophagaceae bacterium]|nr:hypothetical protein [Chitinophagaceae bacterium]